MKLLLAVVLMVPVVIMGGDFANTWAQVENELENKDWGEMTASPSTSKGDSSWGQIDTLTSAGDAQDWSRQSQDWGRQSQDWGPESLDWGPSAKGWAGLMGDQEIRSLYDEFQWWSINQELENKDKETTKENLRKFQEFMYKKLGQNWEVVNSRPFQ